MTVILWDTNRKYIEASPFQLALSNKINWVQVPYQITTYTFTGDVIVENDYYYLFPCTNNQDAPWLIAKPGNDLSLENELYKVNDTGTRNFGMGNTNIKILKNNINEVLIESTETGQLINIPIINTFRVTEKAWVEVKPVHDINQIGMHDKSRLACFVYTDNTKDTLLDGRKHPTTYEENIYSQVGCIGEINFQRDRRQTEGIDFMWYLTFPTGIELNNLTYQGMHLDPYWEWDCKPCSPSVGAQYAYLDNRIIIGCLNNQNNWKREDINLVVSSGDIYTSNFIAPYTGKWRLIGMYTTDSWKITGFNEIVVNAGDHFTYVCPKNGTLQYIVVYLFDRTVDTSLNIITIMDIYRDMLCPDLICNFSITNL